MGMYDNLEIDYPISIPSYIPTKYIPYIRASFNRNGFQTKDLEQIFNSYFIDQSGHLYERIRKILA
jgi:hypothetical protein